jgi:leucyl aminopeptidase
MKFQIDVSGHALTASGRLLIVACFADDFQAGGAPRTRSFADLSRTHSSLLSAAVEQDFQGKSGQLLTHFAGGPVLLLGLGERGKFKLGSLKDGLIKAYRKAKEAKASEVVFDAEPLLALGADPRELGKLLGCYAVMINHNPKHYKTAHSNPKGDFNIKTLKVLAPQALSSKIKRGLTDGRSVAGGVTLARDLVTMPAGHLTPFKLMEAAKGVVARSGGTITGNYFWGGRLRQLGAHALLAVARGSSEAPVLIELNYHPEGGPTAESLCLVGKSVTFDSGGLDLKPADGMRYMKRDMAGGAAVLGAIQAIAALKLPISVKVVMAATENMPDGKAFKPGDVISTMKGLSVEIDNTDGEGRLTLADAIEFAKRNGATRILDFATLTGAVKMIAGDVGAAAFGNHSDFTRKVVDAGVSVGELMVEIPMWEELRKSNETDIADLKNSGGGGAGSTTAAWFIREFAGEEVDWVHVDIAGVAWRERSLGIDPKGATGWGVRTAVALAEALSAK